MEVLELTFLSDTHNKHRQVKVPGGDIIFHCGDATSLGDAWEISEFLDWFAELDYVHRVFTPGNHDFGFERQPGKYQKMFEDAGVHLLIDKSITLSGLNIHGSPMTPWFHNWAFNRARNATEVSLYKVDFIFPHWDLIPNNTDVLITHGPPYGILDELCFPDGTPKGQFVGCDDLLKRVKEVKPKIHAFGHIHCAHGTLEQDGTLFINAANLGETYCYDYEPINVKYVKDQKPELLKSGE